MGDGFSVTTGPDGYSATTVPMGDGFSTTTDNRGQTFTTVPMGGGFSTTTVTQSPGHVLPRYR